MKNQPPGILELIGNTPLIEITRFDTGPCRLFAKLESQNPGGSIKDRIARQMINVAEKEGKLKPGGTIIEATAGNTGLGLTLLGALKGYKVILVVPDKMSREKIFHCKAMGADVRVARSDVVRGHPEYYQDVAARIAEATGGFFVNQFANPANVAAHFEYTGPEIYEQMEHDVDAVVCGVGSGGTLTGIGNYMKKVSPKTEMVLADPVGSILAPMINEGKNITPGSWLVEGIGEDFVPDILDLSLVKKAYAISDEESLATARELLLQEGLLAGPSSGTLAAAALRYCREQTEPKRVVTLICDRGDKYLSKTFSTFWMAEQGFTGRVQTGTIEDLVVRRHDSGDTVTVRLGDTIRTAYKRMRFADVSQLPVLDDQGNLKGIIDEKTLLTRMTQEETADETSLDNSVTTVMRPASPVLQKTTLIEDAAPLLQKGSAVMVADGEKFLGVVTRIDMLNHFYLKGQAA
jgi:cystathionine beta-synthase